VNLAKILISNPLFAIHRSLSAGLQGENGASTENLEMSDFKLATERLSEKNEAFHFEATGAWWNAREPVGEHEIREVEEPFVFDLEARLVGESILLEGTLRGLVSLECSRCGKRYPHALHDGFRLMLEPVRGREPNDPEEVRGLAESGVCLGEDLEAGWFRGPLIRLDDFFGEVIALTMPLQPLCKEDCAGLCSHCGVDLAVTRCDCVDEQIDSPFAVLAKLKGETEDQ
jgi:uncharacterized protein